MCKGFVLPSSLLSASRILSEFFVNNYVMALQFYSELNHHSNQCSELVGRRHADIAPVSFVGGMFHQ